MARDHFGEFLGVLGRLVVFGAVSLGLMLLIGVLLKPVLPSGLPMGDPGRILFALMFALSLMVGHLVIVIAMERTRWEVAGLGVEAWHPVDLLVSLAIGILVVGIPGAAMLGSGVLALDAGVAGSWMRYALMALLPSAVFAAVEELAFRGYLLGLLAERWGPVVAIGVTTLFYAAWHSLGTPATLTALLSFLCVGALFGVLRLRSKSLMAVWLAHLGINWTQIAVLHAPVGWLRPMEIPQYRATSSGAEWLTGSALGIEAGLAAGTAALIALVLVWRYWPKRRVSEREAYGRAQARH